MAVIRRCLLTWLHAFLLVFSSSSQLYAAAETRSLIQRQDPHQNYFTNPPGTSPKDDYQDDPSFEQGSTLNITWETGLPRFDLILLQPALDGNDGQIRLVANTSQRWYEWTVTYSDVTVYAGPIGNVFYFQIRPPSQPNPTYNSHYFNITETQAINASSTVSSSAAINTSMKGSSASANSKPDSTTSQVETTGPSAVPSSSSGLSSGATAAIIVCAAFIAGVLAAGLSWWFCILRRRKQRIARARKVFITETRSSSSTTQSIEGCAQELHATSPIQEIGTRPLPHEMETREPPVELPT